MMRFASGLLGVALMMAAETGMWAQAGGKVAEELIYGPDEVTSGASSVSSRHRPFN